MDGLDLSASISAETPREGSVGPVDIPFHDQGVYAMVDEKAHQIVEAGNQKLDELFEKFTRGFDPKSFANRIMSVVPKLLKNLRPGTYAHLLLLLFSTYNSIQMFQLALEDWLFHHFKGLPIVHPTDMKRTDEIFLGLEIEMLRQLLAPIREGTKNSIFWLNTRRADPFKTCEQLEAAIRVIECFKDDICAALKTGSGYRTTYCNLPVSVERTAMLSMKRIRMDGCRATLCWDSFNGSEIEFTAFFRFYKAHISRTQPEKARASGWLPPSNPQTPRLSAPEAVEGDLASWSSHGVENEIFDLLLKTAMWLSIARGLPAVHLFCDVARLFVLNGPQEKADDEYRCFLTYLTRIRAVEEGTQPPPSPLVFRDDEAFPTRNIDYFEDVWRTRHQLSTGLLDNTSLLVNHNAPNFKLSAAPPRRRAGHPDMHIITEAPLRGNLESIPCTPEENPSQEAADEYDFLQLSPDKPGTPRNWTV
ncbi:hypothetical protein BJX61DRAFT_533687 [Aspergillus egyptiacus]|nr:hypothetical protein BJX61DRAFT_533687 [Aspergillus egyptiacus]